MHPPLPQPDGLNLFRLSQHQRSVRQKARENLRAVAAEARQHLPAGVACLHHEALHRRHRRRADVHDAIRPDIGAQDILQLCADIFRRPHLIVQQQRRKSAPGHLHEQPLFFHPDLVVVHNAGKNHPPQLLRLEKHRPPQRFGQLRFIQKTDGKAVAGVAVRQPDAPLQKRGQRQPPPVARSHIAGHCTLTFCPSVSRVGLESPGFISSSSAMLSSYFEQTCQSVSPLRTV